MNKFISQHIENYFEKPEEYVLEFFLICVFTTLITTIIGMLLIFRNPMLILVSLGMSISVFFVLKKLLDFYAHVCALSYCYNKEETEVKEYKIKVEVVNQHGNTLLFIVVFWPNFLMYTFMFFLVYFLKKVTKAFTSILTGKSPIKKKLLFKLSSK